ncbi:MAG: hypothetical protein K5685_02660 [Bacteroidales bacterium]|nr:hypothetical protein [Bacteroidales bacterium]
MYDGTAWQMIAQNGKDAEPAEPAAEQVIAFSVSSTKKVTFSPGNLLKSSTNEYKFAANQ